MKSPKKKSSKYLSQQQSLNGVDSFAVFLLFVTVAIVPLIVFMKAIKLEGIYLESWTGRDETGDFFTYYKAVVLILCAVLLLGYLVLKLARKQIRLEKIYIPLGIYLVMTVLSTLFAEYKNVAIFGFVERYEGFLVLLAYCIVLVSASVVLNTEDRMENVLIALFISVTIIALLGLTQFYGIDFFQTELGTRLILPKIYEGTALEFAFADQKVMYTTVYNPNYLGSFSALLLPVSLGLYYTWAERENKVKRVLGPIFVASTFILFLGGMSRAGLLGGVLAMVVFVILFRKKIVNNARKSILIIALMAIIYLVMDFTSDNQITREVLSTLPSAMYDQTQEQADGEDSDRSKYVEYFQLENGELVFKTKTEGIRIGFDSTDLSLTFSDDANNSLDTFIKERTYGLSDTRYKDFSIAIQKNQIQLHWNNYSFDFDYTNEQVFLKAKNGEYTNDVDLTSIGAKNVRTEGNRIIFKTNNEELNIIYDGSDIQCMDQEDTPLELSPTSMIYGFEDERFDLYKIEPMNHGFYFIWNDLYHPFKIEDGILKYYATSSKLINRFDEPETFGFKGAEAFASGRGYIWSRSLPMIRKTILLGYGPDTYPIYFPQNEPAAKINFLKSANTIVDKPHSWYLQLAINTGLISLIAMLVFLAWYWVKGFTVFIKDIDGMEKTLGAAILCGVAGYLFAAIFNDSTVSVSPVFWSLLGVGIAIVYRYAPKKKRKEQTFEGQKA